MVNAATTGTPSSVLGPFHIEGAPELPNGGDLWRGQVGEPLVVSGTRRRTRRARRPRARCWRCGRTAATASTRSRTRRARRPTITRGSGWRDDGTFAYSTVRPIVLHGARRRAGRRHAARAGPRRLASGASAHDHPGAGPPAADHRVLPRGRQVSRQRRRVRRARGPGAAVSQGRRPQGSAGQPRGARQPAVAGMDGQLDLTLPPA